MNDLDLVRTVLDGVPDPSPARLAAGRARLLSATAGNGDPRRARRLLLPAGLTAAAAVAAVLAIVLAGGLVTGGSTGSNGSNGSNGSTGVGPAQPAGLAAKVLGTAARVVASEPVTEPKPGQWFFYRTVGIETGQDTRDAEWITFDGTRTAYYGPGPAGRLIVHTEPGAAEIKQGTGALAAFDANITPLTSYNALAALPASPQALLAAVDAELARAWAGQDYFGVTGQAITKPQREFAWLGMLLWNAYAAAPPSALAAVYQAIATLPGVTVDQRVSDAAGRSAIGITDNQGKTEFLLNPLTYQPIGLIVRSPAARAAKSAPGSSLSSNSALASPAPSVTRTAGPQTSSLAIIQVLEVSGPGQK